MMAMGVLKSFRLRAGDASWAGAVVLTLLLFITIPLTSLMQNVPSPTVQVMPMHLTTHSKPTPEIHEAHKAVKQVIHEMPVMIPPVQDICFEPLKVTLMMDVSGALNSTPEPSLALNQDLATEMKSVFALESLSTPPGVLSTPPIVFPKELLRRGIHRGEVVLRILIDEKGGCSVLEVVSFTHRELLPLARDIGNRTRFSTTYIDGTAVKVTGLWPLEIHSGKER